MLHRPVAHVSASQPAGASAGTVGATYRDLRRMGWSEREAGNLAAHLAGLTPSRRGWQIHEVEGLLFIRALVMRGRLTP